MITALLQENAQWLAGWLEGEGSFGNYLHRGQGVIRFDLMGACSDQDVIEKALRLTGMGKIKLHKKAGPGHKKSRVGTNKKDLWAWQVSHRDDVIGVCSAIYPYMGERRKKKIREMINADGQHRRIGSFKRRPNEQSLRILREIMPKDILNLSSCYRAKKVVL